MANKNQTKTPKTISNPLTPESVEELTTSLTSNITSLVEKIEPGTFSKVASGLAGVATSFGKDFATNIFIEYLSHHFTIPTSSLFKERVSRVTTNIIAVAVMLSDDVTSKKRRIYLASLLTTDLLRDVVMLIGQLIKVELPSIDQAVKVVMSWFAETPLLLDDELDEVKLTKFKNPLIHVPISYADLVRPSSPPPQPPVAPIRPPRQCDNVNDIDDLIATTVNETDEIINFHDKVAAALEISTASTFNEHADLESANFAAALSEDAREYVACADTIPYQLLSTEHPTVINYVLERTIDRNFQPYSEEEVESLRRVAAGKQAKFMANTEDLGTWITMGVSMALAIATATVVPSNIGKRLSQASSLANSSSTWMGKVVKLVLTDLLKIEDNSLKEENVALADMIGEINTLLLTPTYAFYAQPCLHEKLRKYPDVITSKITQFSKLHGGNTVAVATLRNELRSLTSQIREKLSTMVSLDSGAIAVEPSMLVLCGRANQGKSYAMNAFLKIVGEIMGYNNGIWTASRDASGHWTQYLNQESAAMDEFISRKKDDPILTELQTILAPTRKILAGAAIEDKRAVSNLKFIVGTTNAPYPEIDLIAPDAYSAIYSRFQTFYATIPGRDNLDRDSQDGILDNFEHMNFHYLSPDNAKAQRMANFEFDNIDNESSTFLDVVHHMVNCCATKELAFYRTMKLEDTVKERIEILQGLLIEHPKINMERAYKVVPTNRPTHTERYRTQPLPRARNLGKKEKVVGALVRGIEVRGQPIVDKKFFVIRHQGLQQTGKTRSKGVVSSALAQKFLLPIIHVDVTFGSGILGDYISKPAIFLFDDIIDQSNATEYIRFVNTLHPNSMILIYTNRIIKKKRFGLGLKKYYDISGWPAEFARRSGTPGPWYQDGVETIANCDNYVVDFTVKAITINDKPCALSDLARAISMRYQAFMSHTTCDTMTFSAPPPDVVYDIKVYISDLKAIPALTPASITSILMHSHDQIKFHMRPGINKADLLVFAKTLAKQDFNTASSCGLSTPLTAATTIQRFCMSVNNMIGRMVLQIETELWSFTQTKDGHYYTAVNDEAWRIRTKGTDIIFVKGNKEVKTMTLPQALALLKEERQTLYSTKLRESLDTVQLTILRTLYEHHRGLPVRNINMAKLQLHKELLKKLAIGFAAIGGAIVLGGTIYGIYKATRPTKVAKIKKEKTLYGVTVDELLNMPTSHHLSFTEEDLEEYAHGLMNRSRDQTKLMNGAQHIIRLGHSEVAARVFPDSIFGGAMERYLRDDADRDGIPNDQHDRARFVAVRQHIRDTYHIRGGDYYNNPKVGKAMNKAYNRVHNTTYTKYKNWNVDRHLEGGDSLPSHFARGTFLGLIPEDNLFFPVSWWPTESATSASHMGIVMRNLANFSENAPLLHAYLVQLEKTHPGMYAKYSKWRPSDVEHLNKSYGDDLIELAGQVDRIVMRGLNSCHGFAITGKFVGTQLHVLTGESQIRVCDKGKWYDAILHYTDPAADLAVVRVVDPKYNDAANRIKQYYPVPVNTPIFSAIGHFTTPLGKDYFVESTADHANWQPANKPKDFLIERNIMLLSGDFKLAIPGDCGRLAFALVDGGIKIIASFTGANDGRMFGIYSAIDEAFLKSCTDSVHLGARVCMTCEQEFHSNCEDPLEGYQKCAPCNDQIESNGQRLRPNPKALEYIKNSPCVIIPSFIEDLLLTSKSVEDTEHLVTIGSSKKIRPVLLTKPHKVRILPEQCYVTHCDKKPTITDVKIMDPKIVAKLPRWKPTGTPSCMLQQALKNKVKPVDIPEDIKRKASALSLGIAKNVLQHAKVQPMGLHTVINGYPPSNPWHNAYSGVDRTTSAGPSYKHKFQISDKHPIFELVRYEKNNARPIYDIANTPPGLYFKEQYELRITSWKERRPVLRLTQMTPKAELRPSAKEGQVRGFIISDTDANVAILSVLGNLRSCFQHNYKRNFSQIGFNPLVDGGHLTNVLEKYNFLKGSRDVAGLDKHTSREIIQSHFALWAKMVQPNALWTREQLDNAGYCMGIEEGHRLEMVDYFLTAPDGTNSSGNAMTTPVNDFTLLWMDCVVMILFILTKPNPLLDINSHDFEKLEEAFLSERFHDYELPSLTKDLLREIRPSHITDNLGRITYGDDSTKSTKPDFAGFFDLEVPVYAKASLELTSADKTSSDIVLAPEFEFCSRTYFRSKDHRNHVVGKLKWESIVAQIHYINPLLRTEPDVLVANLNGALFESHFHGRDNYDTVRTDVETIISKQPYLLSSTHFDRIQLYDYEDLCASFSTLLDGRILPTLDSVDECDILSSDFGPALKQILDNLNVPIHKRETPFVKAHAKKIKDKHQDTRERLIRIADISKSVHLGKEMDLTQNVYTTISTAFDNYTIVESNEIVNKLSDMRHESFFTLRYDGIVIITVPCGFSGASAKEMRERVKKMSKKHLAGERPPLKLDEIAIAIWARLTDGCSKISEQVTVHRHDGKRAIKTTDIIDLDTAIKVLDVQTKLPGLKYYYLVDGSLVTSSPTILSPMDLISLLPPATPIFQQYNIGSIYAPGPIIQPRNRDPIVVVDDVKPHANFKAVILSVCKELHLKLPTHAASPGKHTTLHYDARFSAASCNITCARLIKYWLIHPPSRDATISAILNTGIQARTYEDWLASFGMSDNPAVWCEDGSNLYAQMIVEVPTRVDSVILLTSLQTPVGAGMLGETVSFGDIHHKPLKTVRYQVDGSKMCHYSLVSAPPAAPLTASNAPAIAIPMNQIASTEIGALEPEITLNKFNMTGLATMASGKYRDFKAQAYLHRPIVTPIRVSIDAPAGTILAVCTRSPNNPHLTSDFADYWGLHEIFDGDIEMNVRFFGNAGISAGFAVAWLDHTVTTSDTLSLEQLSHFEYVEETVMADGAATYKLGRNAQQSFYDKTRDSMDPTTTPCLVLFTTIPMVTAFSDGNASFIFVRVTCQPASNFMVANYTGLNSTRLVSSYSSSIEGMPLRYLTAGKPRLLLDGRSYSDWSSYTGNDVIGMSFTHQVLQKANDGYPEWMLSTAIGAAPDADVKNWRTIQQYPVLPDTVFKPSSIGQSIPNFDMRPDRVASWSMSPLLTPTYTKTDGTPTTPRYELIICEDQLVIENHNFPGIKNDYADSQGADNRTISNFPIVVTSVSSEYPFEMLPATWVRVGVVNYVPPLLVGTYVQEPTVRFEDKLTGILTDVGNAVGDFQFSLIDSISGATAGDFRWLHEKTTLVCRSSLDYALYAGNANDLVIRNQTVAAPGLQLPDIPPVLWTSRKSASVPGTRVLDWLQRQPMSNITPTQERRMIMSFNNMAHFSLIGGAMKGASKGYDKMQEQAGQIMSFALMGGVGAGASSMATSARGLSSAVSKTTRATRPASLALQSRSAIQRSTWTGMRTPAARQQQEPIPFDMFASEPPPIYVESNFASDKRAAVMSERVDEDTPVSFMGNELDDGPTHAKINDETRYQAAVRASLDPTLDLSGVTHYGNVISDTVGGVGEQLVHQGDQKWQAGQNNLDRQATMGNIKLGIEGALAQQQMVGAQQAGALNQKFGYDSALQQSGQKHDAAMQQQQHTNAINQTAMGSRAGAIMAGGIGS